MNRNKFNNKKLIILFVILFISIGFALLSTNLNIRGLVGFNSKWDVHLENIQVLNNDINAEFPIISEDKTTINFGGTFKSPGDVFEFSVDVFNAGTIDAMLNILTKAGINATNENYLNYTVSYDDNSEITKYDLLKNECRVRLKIKVEYKYDIENVPSLEQQNFSLSLEYASSTSDAVDRGNSFKTSNSDNVVTIANAKENSLDNLRIYGNNEQKQYEGYQLIKKDGLSTLKSDSEFWSNSQYLTPLSDGWSKLGVDNTDGTDPQYCNFFISKKGLELEPDTFYTAYVEWRNLDGINHINLSQYSMWVSDPISEVAGGERIALEGQKSGKAVRRFRTKSDLTSAIGLRGFVGVGAGKKASIEIRLLIVKGDRRSEDLEYEPYVGEIPSPSPEYPQEIKSVEGESSIDILGTNLFNYDSTYTWTDTGLTYNRLSKDSWSINGSSSAGNTEFRLIDWWGSLVPRFTLEEGNYKLSAWIDDTQIKIIPTLSNGQNTKVITSDSLDSSFTIDKEYYGISSLMLTIPDGTYDNSLLKIMLIDTDVNPDVKNYIELKEKSYPISLGDIKLNGSADGYRDYIHNINGKWYIHKAVDIDVLDGDKLRLTYRTPVFDSISFEFGYDSTTAIASKEADVKFKGLCDKLIATNRDNTYLKKVENGIAPVHTAPTPYGTGHVIYIIDNNQMSLNEFNEWLKLNPLTIYYPLSKYVEIEIKDQTLINQLNAILNNNLSDGYNRIIFNSNINSKIEMDYKVK